jgi:hypothetical protein
MIHPLGLSWKMIPFSQHLELAFALVQARGEAMVGCSAFYMFIPHHTFYFDLNVAFLS